MQSRTARIDELPAALVLARQVRVSNAWIGVGSFVVLEFEGVGLRSIWIQFSEWTFSKGGRFEVNSEFEVRDEADPIIRQIRGRTMLAVIPEPGRMKLDFGTCKILVCPQATSDYVSPDDDAITFFMKDGSYSFRNRDGWRFSPRES